jgi:hypothetical protein
MAEDSGHIIMSLTGIKMAMSKRVMYSETKKANPKAAYKNSLKDSLFLIRFDRCSL